LSTFVIFWMTTFNMLPSFWYIVDHALCIIFSNSEKSSNMPRQIRFFKIFGSRIHWNSKPLCEVWWNHSIAIFFAHLVSNLSRLTLLFYWTYSTTIARALCTTFLCHCLHLLCFSFWANFLVASLSQMCMSGFTIPWCICSVHHM
jgi:hypothetical protein